jgi:hypothetical protein
LPWSRVVTLVFPQCSLRGTSSKVAVARTCDPEVTAVECRDPDELEAFRENDQAGVGAAEAEVGGSPNELAMRRASAHVIGSASISSAGSPARGSRPDG